MKIAIVKLSALGDIVHAMVALQFIKAFNKNIQIDWIVEQGFAEILRHNPDINKILTVNLKALKQNKMGLWAEIKKVRAFAENNYDLVIDAQGLLKSAITAKLIGSNIIGFDKYSIREKAACYLYTKKIHYPYNLNTIDRNTALLSEPFEFKINTQQIYRKKAFLYYSDTQQINNYISLTSKNILLVIGSSKERKNYPKEKFLQVANELKQNALLVWGNQAEKEKAEWIANHSSYTQVLPRLSLNELKALIAHSDLTIGNDTGPSHMAWGLNKPSLLLFGCTPTSVTYQTDINKVIKSNSAVNPYKLNKQDFSIQDIKVQDVVNIARELLK